MLKVAYERIKAVDPVVTVVSAGLAPVGRIQGTCNRWSGNDCGAMDEREFAQQMFLLDRGESFDVFGYHPYGVLYEPETNPSSVSNGFAFRGAEVMRELLVQHNLGHKPIWATEFSWLRNPSEDGGLPSWCHRYEEEYEIPFGWMDVTEVQQADYLTRAFQYADDNWPWMGAMFVWNLDWHDYNWLCHDARYFSVLKVDYAEYRPRCGPRSGLEIDLRLCVDRPTVPYKTALAYDALAVMEKRPGAFGAELWVEPASITITAGVEKPGSVARVVVPRNAGYGVLTWTASVGAGLQVTPTLLVTTGLQGMPLTLTVDSTGFSTGSFSGSFTVTATAIGVRNSPVAVPVTLRVLSELNKAYLPLMLRATR
jgi:hypothetical protein